MLCGVVSNNLVALCHPLPYGRRAAPLRKDDGALEGKTNNYATSMQVQRHDVRPAGSVTPVAIGPVRLSPPSQVPSRPLHRHPRHCGSYCTPVRPRVNSTLESSHRRLPNKRSQHRHPRSRSWARTGRAMTPRRGQDSPGRTSTLRRCTPCLYT
jgi:hypothetical protein